MSRRAERAARRAELSGSGPVRAGGVAPRWPGATSAFALFGEVLLTGVIVAVASVPLITVPFALALGHRHLRRYLAAEDSGWGALLRDARHVLRSLPLGLAALVLAAALAVDLALAIDAVVPGAPIVGLAGCAGVALLVLALVTAAREWSPETGWRAALRSLPAIWRADLAGVLYVIAAAGFVVVVTWQLPPLVVPALGCLVFASLAVPERPRRDAA